MIHLYTNHDGEKEKDKLLEVITVAGQRIFQNALIFKVCVQNVDRNKCNQRQV